MRNLARKIFVYLIITTLMLTSINTSFFTSSVQAHSGRTDSNGGHKDNKNKSGLGYYHYHCGGNPPHLHNNGVCPYDYTTMATPTPKPTPTPTPTPKPTITPTPKPTEIKKGNETTQKESTKTIVYITKTGKKYHLSSCSYLRKSKIKTTVKKAKQQGLTACSRCNPPE